MTSSSSTKIQLFEPIDGVDPVNRVTIGFPAQQPPCLSRGSGQAARSLPRATAARPETRSTWRGERA